MRKLGSGEHHVISILREGGAKKKAKLTGRVMERSLESA